MSDNLPEIEAMIIDDGVVVEGRHPMTLGGTCLTCGRSDLSPGCDGLSVPVFTFDPQPVEPADLLKEGDVVRVVTSQGVYDVMIGIDLSNDETPPPSRS